MRADSEDWRGSAAFYAKDLDRATLSAIGDREVTLAEIRIARQEAWMNGTP